MVTEGDEGYEKGGREMGGEGEGGGRERGGGRGGKGEGGGTERERVRGESCLFIFSVVSHHGSTEHSE